MAKKSSKTSARTAGKPDAEPAAAKARKPSRRSPARTKPGAAQPASTRIDQRIHELGGWRGATLARMRELVLRAVPGIVEEWKWENPVWSRDGIVCTGEAYAKAVKLTFAHGARIPDPKGLFNSSLTGRTRRAIDVREGEKVDARAFQALVKAAAAYNASRAKAGAKAEPARGGSKAAKKAGERGKVVLLSGGNPQIAKGEGDAPVQAYVAAMPGWKREVGERLDALIVRTVPGVRKAVKWNSPFYGVEGRGWFLSFHVFTHYVKVTFFAGTSLRPMPPGGTERSKDARWVDVREGELDEAQMAKWVKQAAALPGWVT